MGLTARMVFMAARWSCSGVTVDSIPGRGLYTPWWDNVVDIRPEVGRARHGSRWGGWAARCWLVEGEIGERGNHFDQVKWKKKLSSKIFALTYNELYLRPRIFFLYFLQFYLIKLILL